jgi:excisionase family DNA binding protein
MPPSRLLTPSEVAEILSVKESQVYTLMRSGQLHALKVGHRGVWRVHETDLQDYIESLRKQARQRASDELARADFGE